MLNEQKGQKGTEETMTIKHINRIILASASPRRKELLAMLGLKFEVIPSHMEEKVTHNIPEQVVEELANQKATDIWERYGRCGTLVIGADTIVVGQQVIMGKPKDKQDAVSMLQKLQGDKHRVYTGITLIWQQDKSVKRKSFHTGTVVEVYPMNMHEIEAYVETGEPMDKAGAYGIQGRFAPFIKGIEGEYQNVVGLPIGRLYQELKEI